ncbi:MAG: hypothetical protein IPN96_03355 [Anaerolineales bacterium]|nr:hypothetical protein [Anaerolineales bacterium]
MESVIDNNNQRSGRLHSAIKILLTPSAKDGESIAQIAEQLNVSPGMIPPEL